MSSMNRNSLNALAYFSLAFNFIVLVTLIATMALMSWHGKGWDATFITFISTLTGMSFGWTGMAFAWKFGSSQNEASNNDQAHEATMAQTPQVNGAPVAPVAPPGAT